VTLALGVDVGGSKVAAGVVAPDGTVLARARSGTPSTDVVAIAAAVAELVGELQEPFPDVAALGVGAAGWVDPEGSRVLFAPHLAWRDEPLRDRLAGLTGLPVTVVNDADAAAWAELRFGAGRGARHLVVLTFGTGIGCGLVLSGALHRGWTGVAGEPGHVRVVPAGRRCECGNRGCWEQYASGRALVREARELSTSAPALASLLLELVDGDVTRIDGPVITEAASLGDPAALECFSLIGGWLGQGLADLAALLDPERFVIGGGLGDAGELLLGPARASYRARLSGRGHRAYAEVVAAELGNDAGLVGAAELARGALTDRVER